MLVAGLNPLMGSRPGRNSIGDLILGNHVRNPMLRSLIAWSMMIRCFYDSLRVYNLIFRNICSNYAFYFTCVNDIGCKLQILDYKVEKP